MGKTNKKSKNRKKINKHEKDESYEIKGKKNSKSKKSGKNKNSKLKLIFKIIGVLILLAIVIVAGAVVAIIGSDSKWAKMTEEDLQNENNLILANKDGEEISTVAGLKKRKSVTLDQIPQYMQDAYVSIEDERFYSHSGVDLKRTLGATVTYILHAGKSSYGGSTITQQLVKNKMEDDEDSGIAGIQRKVREISRAYQLEKQYSKKQILEMYLNEIFVGADVYGVELGAKYYFNKSVSDLTLTECAFMAGINHSPNSYNPFGENDRSDKIKSRTKTVLAKMKELGKITTEEYNASIAEVEAGIKFEKGDTTSGTMSYLARAAYEQVAKEYAEKEGIETSEAKRILNGSGYKIYTTQDDKIQSIAEDVYRNSDEHIFYGKATNNNGELINEGHTQGAIVIIDHKTGYVVGCMGGLGDDVNSTGLNRATQSSRRPGSSIKPIAAIAPALEAGIITASTVYDESTTSFGDYTPSPHKGYSLVTVRKGIEFSANTMSVKILSELGPNNSIAFLRKLGITSLVTASENSAHNDENLALVLGGLTNGVTPLEMAEAYTTIANDGVHITPTFYTKVEDSSGNVILEAKQESNRVISEGNAYILKSILTGPVIGADGTAGSAKISGQDTAGKTGTTDNNYDRWFCGFTNYYTAASWFGFDIGEDLWKAGANRINRATALWKSVMSQIHKGLDNSSFEKPSNVVTAKVCKTSGKLATDECTDTYTEYFVKGTVPDYCDGHVVLNICKETGKIANENCPDVEKKTYIKKPEKEVKGNWSTNDGDKYDVPTETCTTHTEKQITVPDLKGKTKSEAEKAIKDLGLVTKIEYIESTTDIDKVISQDVAAGVKAKKGTTITITVGKSKAENNNTTDNTEKNNTVTNTENKEENGSDMPN